jgi:hypothetical protein
MIKSEYDEIIELSAKHFSDQMELDGWLGVQMEKLGFDLSEISENVVHEIFLKTLIKLKDENEEELELEEDEEYDAEDDEEEEEEDFDEDDDEDI